MRNSTSRRKERLLTERVEGLAEEQDKTEPELREAAASEETEGVVGEEVDESGDPMPEGEEFPHHKGGGYYVLSDGSVVRGQDEAQEAEEALRNQ